MGNMTEFIESIDQLICGLGKFVSWFVPAMAITVFAVVLLRYGFNTSAIAAQESVQYMYATIFMLGAATTLQADKHVRVDIFYRTFSKRQKTWVNILGNVVFTLPICALIGLGSLGYVIDSWNAMEISPEPGGLPFVYLFKTLIPAMALMLAAQALSHIYTGIGYLLAANDR